jgi:hypothetical protein
MTKSVKTDWAQSLQSLQIMPGNMVQWYSMCFAFMRTQVQSPPLKKKSRWSLWEILSPVQTQRMDSETSGVQWKWDFNGDLILQDPVPGKQRSKVFTTSIILPSEQVLSLVPCWLSTMECTGFLVHHLSFLLGYLKIFLSWFVKF